MKTFTISLILGSILLSQAIVLAKSPVHQSHTEESFQIGTSDEWTKFIDSDLFKTAPGTSFPEALAYVAANLIESEISASDFSLFNSYHEVKKDSLAHDYDYTVYTAANIAAGLKELRTGALKAYSESQLSQIAQKAIDCQHADASSAKANYLYRQKVDLKKSGAAATPKFTSLLISCLIPTRVGHSGIEVLSYRSSLTIQPKPAYLADPQYVVSKAENHRIVKIAVHWLELQYLRRFE